MLERHLTPGAPEACHGVLEHRAAGEADQAEAFGEHREVDWDRAVDGQRLNSRSAGTGRCRAALRGGAGRGLAPHVAVSREPEPTRPSVSHQSWDGVCLETEGFPDTRAGISEVPCTQAPSGRSASVNVSGNQRPGWAWLSGSFGTIARRGASLSAPRAAQGRPVPGCRVNPEQERSVVDSASARNHAADRAPGRGRPGVRR